MRFKTIGLAAALLTLSATAGFSEQVEGFDFELTRTCIRDSVSWETQLACIGTAAMVCVDDGSRGQSTFRQGVCFKAEYLAWQAWLDEIYPQLLEQTRAADEEVLSEPTGHRRPASQHETLTKLQEAWLAYRDASCDFEAAVWGAGSGAGPAYAGCMMVETGTQVLRLNGFMMMQ